MATIRADLVGAVAARNSSRELMWLRAGDPLPAGYWVSGPLLTDGDPADLMPPWIVDAGRVSVAWDEVTGKPANYPAAVHSHAQADVTGLPGALNETVTGGSVVGDDLILTQRGGTEINAGNVRGPQGDPAA